MMVVWSIVAMTFALWAAAPVGETPAPAAAPAGSASAQQAFDLIRERFRSHRPAPPFVSYTLIRTNYTLTGAVDPGNSYTKHVWVRTSDGAALSRIVLDGARRGPLSFDRPAFNEPRDPGPPTADLFAVAADSSASSEQPAYRAHSIAVEGDLVHVRLTPVRDPDRNRLREVFADKASYELRKVVTVDTLFVDGGPTYPVTLTITYGVVQSVPVVTEIQGLVGGGYNEDGKEVDFAFSDIAFPAALPDWYFDSRTYRQHEADGPV
jgi:hypothetical protein